MKIEFYGAAQEVTGSQHLLTINGKNVLLDCGMFQGRRKEAFEKNRSLKIDSSKIDVMLLSHAHIDHSGNIPTLVKNGFRGSIFATTATVDLCQIMLRDTAYLQERDIIFVNKKRKKEKKNLFEPLYDINDVEKAMKQFVGIQYNRRVEVLPGIFATFRDAGHVLGSSGIHIEYEENGHQKSLGYTGDIGRNDMPILRNPDILRDVDYLIMESTYGNRLHEKEGEVEEELSNLINEVYRNKGKIIIPSFAIGRTQIVVYMLHKLFEQNRIPKIPIYVDSPLAVRATDVFRSHPECFDRETYNLFLLDKEDPFGFESVNYITEVEESKRLNTSTESCIIISASGMAEAGRILHHLSNNIENPNNLILFVGYAAENTLARKIMDGSPVVNILGDQYQVRSKIKKMDYFSAHADRDDLLNYLSLNNPEKLKKVFLVHGEAEQAIEFQKIVKSKGYKEVYYPSPDEKFNL